MFRRVFSGAVRVVGKEESGLVPTPHTEPASQVLLVGGDSLGMGSAIVGFRFPSRSRSSRKDAQLA